MTEPTDAPSSLSSLERASESSKLRESIKQYGSNSYYYAHSRPMDVPADAIVRGGDGVVTGGQPVLLACEAKPVEKPKRKVTAFAWCDDNEKVKIYLEDAAFLTPGAVLQHEFTESSVRFETADALFHVENLEDAIDVNGSTFRTTDKRITISLKKTKPNKTWYSLKSPASR